MAAAPRAEDAQEASQSSDPQTLSATPDIHRSPTVASRLGNLTGGNSLWRFPSTPGKMPRYLQRAFRLKTLGLMALQLVLVFGIMVLIDNYGVWELISMKVVTTLQTQILFYILGLLNLVCMMILYCFKDSFPRNYLMLAVTTVTSGVFWGLTRIVINTRLHFQIVGILAATMVVAAAMSSLLELQNARKLSSAQVVITSLGSGWIISSLVDVVIMHAIFDAVGLVVLGAIGFSFLLLCILLLDAGKFLVRCHPDDFMTVIVAMNSTLMVVVSIPFFVLSFCFLHAGDAIDEAEDVQAAPEAATIGRGAGAEAV